MTQSPKTAFLLRAIQPYRGIVFLLIVFSILASGFDGISIGLLVPLMSSLQQVQETEKLPDAFQWMADVLAWFPGNNQAMIAILFVFAAIVLKNLFTLFSIKLGYWLSTRVIADLRRNAMAQLLKVGIDFHYKSKAGELIEKVMNNTGHVEFIIRMGIECIANAFTFLMLFGMLFLLSWQLTLATAILGLLVLPVIIIYTRSFRKIGKIAAESGQSLMHAFHQTLGGMQVIKSYSKEAEQTGFVNAEIEANRHAEYRRNFKAFTINPLTDTLGTAVIAILFILAMQMYSMNIELMLAQLLPFMYILVRIVPLAKFLHSKRGEVLSRLWYVETVHQVMRGDDKPFINDGERIFEGLKRDIQFRAVTFAYQDAGDPVLHDVDFCIPAGQTTAIVGDSGAGKSTIANLLLRLYDPTRGDVLIDGDSLRSFKLKGYHDKIGIVSQDTFLFNDSIHFNIAFGAQQTATRAQVISAAEKAGAHEFITALPDGYDTVVGDRGVRLSGGQRQRLAIARAIIREPEILILDEATSALDSITERRIREAVKELSDGRTVIVIAHRLSTIQGADQIVVLKDGRVAEIGTEKLLLEKEGEYYKLARAHKVF